MCVSTGPPLSDVAVRVASPLPSLARGRPGPWYTSSGGRVDVGPVRLLPVVRLVVDDARSFEVDDPRERERARPRTDAALDVLGELVWKGQQNALDDIAFLYREIATIAVGHPSQPTLD